MSLNFVFSKSMNLNLNFVFSKSMNLNLNFIFSTSMNLNVLIKHSTNFEFFGVNPYKANVAICNWFTINRGDFVRYGHFLFYSFKPATDGTQKLTYTDTDHLRSHLSNHIMFAFVSAAI